MGTFLLASGIILVVLSVWVAVQHLSRWFSARHPEFGFYANKHGGCGACGGGCQTRTNEEHECDGKQ